MLSRAKTKTSEIAVVGGNTEITTPLPFAPGARAGAGVPSTRVRGKRTGHHTTNTKNTMITTNIIIVTDIPVIP